jgi:hypothetical protein
MHGWPSGSPQPAHDYTVWCHTGTTEPADPMTDATILATGTCDPGNDWVEIPIAAYGFDPTDTVWVGVAWDQASGEFPAGMDDSGYTPDKSGYIYSTATGWTQLYLVGFYYHWNLWAGVEPAGAPGEEYPDPDVYIPCGEQEVCVLIKNLGTYDEVATVHWELYEYEPAKTLVASGSEDEPIDALTEEEVCLFTYDFTEGIFGVEVFVTIPKDCDPTNNGPIEVIIGVDCCGPESCFILDPEYPDGLNNWFISKVTVTAYAWETGECIANSGIDRIVYIVDGVADFISGDHGTFVIEGDGVHFCEIYAVDKAGNEELEHHTFEVAIDTTPPTCDLQHDEYKDEAGTWFVHFLAVANDATSGMNRVEFFIDGALQHTDDTGPFEWTIEWDPDYKTKTFYAYAYDNAGNSNSDDVPGSEIPIGNSKPKDQSQIKSKELSRTLVKQTPKGIF